MSFKRFSLFVSLVCASFVAAKPFNNTLYVVSNAETPAFNQAGFTPIGKQRVEECMPKVFSNLNIGLVLSCPFDKDSGLCSETIATATPTANALGLPVTTTCGAGEEDDDDCLSNLMRKFAKTSTQSILLVWDLNAMDDLFENLDVSDGNDDDDDDDDNEVAHFDVITTVVKNHVTNTTSMGCEGIDGQAPGTFRKRSIRRRDYNPTRSSTWRRPKISSRITGRWA